MARYPVPSDVIERLDADDISVYGQAQITQRAENRKLIAEASKQINAIYDSGALFFTKDAIRDIARQLDELTPRITWREGDKAKLKFNVRGIDGVCVDVPVELGEVLPYTDRPDVDIV